MILTFLICSFGFGRVNSKCGFGFNLPFLNSKAYKELSIALPASRYFLFLLFRIFIVNASKLLTTIV